MTTVAPPFHRDRAVHGWILLKAISDAGDAAWILAIAWSAVTAASPAIAGLVITAGTIPRAIALLVGGVLADRWDPRLLMIATTVARVGVLIATLVAINVSGETLPLLFAVAIAFGICDAIFEPSSTSLTRQLIREEDFAAIAGVGQTASRIGHMLGAASGGVLVAWGGLAAAAAANAVAYVGVIVYLVFVLRARYPRTPAPPEPMLRAIAGGFRYLRRDELARTLVLSLLGLNLCVSPAMSVGLALLVKYMGAGSATLGALEATFGVGAMVGALVFVRFKPTRPALVGFVLLTHRRKGFRHQVVQGLAVASFAIGIVPAAFATCAVIGLTAGAASTLLAALFMRTIAADGIGRVVSIQKLGDDGLMPAATAAFGAIAATSLPVTFVLFGGAMSVYMATTALRWRRR